MDQTGEVELVVRARAGDADAFATLVSGYRLAAVRLAYGITGDEAEDAVQDAFVKAFRKLHTFRPGSMFRPWLLTIVAISLGAPFWFDTLQRFVNIRGGGKNPEPKTEKGGA